MRRSSPLAAALVATGACGAAPPARAPSPSPSPSPSASGTVRAIDWLNRTYDVDGPPITVVGGEAELVLDPDQPDVRGGFSVAAPSFGDVDQDGREDALLVTWWWPGGAGRFSRVLIYTVPSGAREPALLGEIPGGDRGDGGILRARLTGAVIEVERLHARDDEGACCPSQLQHERWRWDGRRFVEDEAARRIGPLAAAP